MRISEKERLTELYYCLKAVPMELWESENYQIVINEGTSTYQIGTS